MAAFSNAAGGPDGSGDGRAKRGDDVHPVCLNKASLPMLARTLWSLGVAGLQESRFSLRDLQ